MSIQSLFDLRTKVAIVTGAGDGIGKGCCELLAQAGASVVVSDRDLDKAEALAKQIIEKGGIAIAIECDVLDQNQLVNLVDSAIKHFGTVNILVNNVGGGGGGQESPFNIDLAYVERIYMLNTLVPWQLSKLCAPYMEKSGYGSIVNISSMASVNISPGMNVYASSKAALNHLSANLAFDFGPMGIRINSVAPGATRTKALASVLTAEIEQKMLARTPIKRLGEVSDVAGAVLYFASPVSAWVSGQVLFVNGGGLQTLD